MNHAKSKLKEQKKRFNMEKIKQNIVNFIKNYVETSGANGVILGMSGGKDSFIAAALCKEALGKDKVFGLIMPNGLMTDLSVAKEECEYLEINHKVFDIHNLYEEVETGSKNILETQTLTSLSTINLAPRLRMTMLYTVGGTLGYLVVGTSNLSETMIGYTTKWGDNVGDFCPLAGLTKTEVCALGDHMGLPAKFVFKKPDDGLSGKTDEEKIGFSYDELDDFIRNGNKGPNFDKIIHMHKVSAHKRNLPTKCEHGLQNHFYIDKKGQV